MCFWCSWLTTSGVNKINETDTQTCVYVVTSSLAVCGPHDLLFRDSSTEEQVLWGPSSQESLSPGVQVQVWRKKEENTIPPLLCFTSFVEDHAWRGTGWTERIIENYTILQHRMRQHRVFRLCRRSNHSDSWHTKVETLWWEKMEQGYDFDKKLHNIAN